MSLEIEQPGHAIEVATMLGDSVVDVKHCMDPRGGKVSSKTWALLAVGALCMVLSACAFYASVTTAAHNASALDYWTQVAHKPAYSYRPQLLGSGYDIVAFGGFALGIITMIGALLRVRDERRSPYYRVGTAPGVEQPVEGAPTASFPLVAPAQDGDAFVFNFAPGIAGDAVIDGRTLPLAELAASGRARPSSALPGAYELPLAHASRIRAHVGRTAFVVSAVARPRRHATPLLAGMQSRTLAYFGGSLGAHLALVLLLSFVPVEGGAATADLAIQELTEIKTNGGTQEEVPPEPVEHDDGGGGESGVGAQMALAEGAAGTTATNRVDGHMRIKNNNIDPQLARQQAIDEARSAGVLGVVRLQSGDYFASLTETGSLSSGFDTENVRGPLYGGEGEGYGTFGYGRTGFGAGGGCTQEPCGIIGTGPGYGRIGLGKYGRSGWAGPGGGIPGGRKHVAGVPDPVIGQPTSVGDLDRAIIRRYIKRNVEKIKYCYEKELLAHPDMAGTISVSFFISPTGSVKSASGSGFDATVAHCVADVVSTIEFPKPSGGGVQVNYPFTFHAPGR